VSEEFFHVQRRYNGNIKKMYKACFSGFSWGALCVACAVVFIYFGILSASTHTFEPKYAACILIGGIGVVPLIMHLLNPNSQSEVHVSTILDKHETNPGDILAWSYYLNYLEPAAALLKFPNNKCILDQEQQIQLSLNTLILLISHNCQTTDNLEELDINIRKLGETSIGKHNFPVYRLTYNDVFVIKYMREPLETLHKMSHYAELKRCV
jgi:hypothetical protein